MNFSVLERNVIIVSSEIKLTFNTPLMYPTSVKKCNLKYCKVLLLYSIFQYWMLQKSDQHAFTATVFTCLLFITYCPKCLNNF